MRWYNFRLIWLHRFLVIETTKRKIKLTPTGEGKNQGTPAVATLHNIPINNILNLHYLQVSPPLLQKTKNVTSVQNIFHYLYTPTPCAETGVIGKKNFFLYTKTMKKVVGSVGIGFVNEDFWKKKWQHLFFYMLNNREHRR